MAKSTLNKPFFDKDGYSTVCQECCKNIMKSILREHNVTKLKLKNPIDFQELMEITCAFIAEVESAENQQTHEQHD
jgi:hypothetical protein